MPPAVDAIEDLHGIDAAALPQELLQPTRPYVLRGEAAAHILDLEGPGPERQRQHPRPEQRQGQAETRQPEEDEEELHQQRRVADELDIEGDER